MYFLILLFVIVLLNLFLKYTNIKIEQFSEYQYYKNKIKEKIKDLEEKKKIILSMKKETQNNIKKGNLALNNNNRNKRRLME